MATCRVILLVLLAHVTSATDTATRPNIILIVADDVGFADVSFTAPLLRPPPPRAIVTPQLDALARRGVVLAQYYTHSTCTPSRASLMTGRYAQNTGLSFAMLPGSVAGLPEGMETLPKLLREEAGYAAHMIGKWHVGHAQWKQTPVGSNIGFETHVGSYLWSMEYWRKGMWELPWQHFALDWVRASENRTYAHYAEPRHTTVAITEEAVARIETHARGVPAPKTWPTPARETYDAIEASAANAASSGAAASAGGGEKPLFLYVAYTAAHAPLEPEEQDLAHCTHIPHAWRRGFCGLVKGLDRGVGQVVAAAEAELGPNTFIVFTSDNGGAPWFGGLNAPLRGGKTTPFEGGVRVPTFVLDLRREAKGTTEATGANGANGATAGKGAKTKEEKRATTKEVKEGNAARKAGTGEAGAEAGAEGGGGGGSDGGVSTDSADTTVVWRGLSHVSDWMPTFAALAGIPSSAVQRLGLDGHDLTGALDAVHAQAGEIAGETAGETPRKEGNDKAATVGKAGDTGGVEGQDSPAVASAAAATAAAALPSLRVVEVEVESPRKEVLHEMYYYSRGEFLFPEDVVALRVGPWKLVESVGMRDSHWYSEPIASPTSSDAGGSASAGGDPGTGGDWLNSSDETYVTVVGEWVLKWLESWTTAARFDTIQDLMVHIVIHGMFRDATAREPPAKGAARGRQKQQLEDGTVRGDVSDDPNAQVMLFNIDNDETERHNVALDHPDVVMALRKRAREMAAGRPPQQEFWMTIDREQLWDGTLKQGDCSSNKAAVYGRYPPPESERDEEGEARAEQLCRFAHPWVRDNVSLDSVPVTFGAATWPFVRAVLVWAVGGVWARVVVPAIVVVVCVRFPRAPTRTTLAVAIAVAIAVAVSCPLSLSLVFSLSLSVWW